MQSELDLIGLLQQHIDPNQKFLYCLRILTGEPTPQALDMPKASPDSTFSPFPSEHAGIYV